MPDEVVYPKFQSTLLQEERHVDRTWSDHFFCISIHAPTRGATKSSLKWMISVYDFNPRSYKRSDKTEMVKAVRWISFNPRSYKRSDQCIFYCIRRFNLSIHVPTRGATIFKFRFRIVFLLSIHAPTRGATYTDSEILKLSHFQSTLLQEERPHAYTSRKPSLTFNPRSYKRSDCFCFNKKRFI